MQPASAPSSSNCQYWVASPISQTAGTQATISKKNTMRPPKRSVHIPSGSRISEPVSTGVAASKPNWVAFRPSFSLIGMPITANIIQIAKHTVNASVLIMRTESCWRLSI